MTGFIARNAFFPEKEVSFKDCPLGRKSLEVPKEVDLLNLDKPISLEPLALEKYKDVTDNEFRDLTDEEKADIKKALGWVDAQIAKCKINEEGIIQYRTDNCDFEGKEGPREVRYERKRVIIHGVVIEGVFPVFNSLFDVQLPRELERASNAKQFGECNRQLKAAVEKDPDLRDKFTAEQLEEIADGETPTGYTWHHNEEEGKIQLVKTEEHDKTQGGAAHTGGKALWGDKYGVYAATHNNIENGVEQS